MKPNLFLAAGLLGLVFGSGCSPSKSAPEKAAPRPPAAATAPPAPARVLANADGAVWSFWQTEEGSHLSFAAPESDDVVNYLVCQSGSGTLQASFWADHAVPGEPGPEARTEPGKLTLTSGAVSQTYDATAEGEEMYGGSQVTGDVGLSDPVIAEFARTGVIQMSAFGQQTAMPAAPLVDVQKMLKACKKAG
jgi:hypothetical protein